MISRGQMYRQLYMGGGQGITSLDAGAPSIKYTGNINPNKPTGPLAPFYEYFDLEKPKPKPESEEALLKEGIMQMIPREGALFGGIKKAVKKVTGAVKDVVKSDLGKAALLAAGTYYAGGGNLFGLQRAGLSGFSFNNIPGVLQARNFLQGVPLGDGDPRSGGFLSRIGKGITGLSTGQKIGLATTAIGGLTGYLASQGMDEQQIEEVKSRPEALKTYLRQYYVNLNPELKNQPEKVEAFVNSQLSEYAYATGGRVKYAKGTDRDQQTTELKDVDPNLRAGPDWYIKRIEALMYEYDMDYDTAAEIAFDSDKYFELMPDGLAKGGRPGYAMGNTAQMAAGIEGLPFRQNQAGVGEVDLRETGGFIPPVGVKEKADDIPAMLSNNEFVFTADAVRGMGDGNVNVGAQRMYDMMKKLEKGGRV